MLGFKEIKAILPQSYPFLMIDKVIEFKKGESLTAVKNITANEWFFTGHSEDSDVLPEILIIEAGAQAALILYYLTMIINKPSNPKYSISKVNARIYDTFKTGDRLIVTAYATKLLSWGGYSEIKIFKDRAMLAKLTMTFSVKQKAYEK